MAKPRKKQSLLYAILAILVAIASWYLKNHSDALDKLGADKLVVGNQLSDYKVSTRDFTVLEHCKLRDHRNNDGDSFHVIQSQGETEFRLYFVDTAESRKHRHNGERIADQARAFGINEQATIEIGRVAKSFVKDLLKSKPFTVLTKWEEVYGPERRYAYVVVDYEGRPVYLHELLVAKGYVRLKTRGADMPDGRKFHAYKRWLVDLEKRAKEARQGAWGM